MLECTLFKKHRIFCEAPIWKYISEFQKVRSIGGTGPSKSQQQMKSGRRKGKKVEDRRGRNFLVLYWITTGLQGFILFSCFLFCYERILQLVLAFSFKYMCFWSFDFSLWVFSRYTEAEKENDESPYTHSVSLTVFKIWPTLFHLFPPSHPCSQLQCVTLNRIPKIFCFLKLRYLWGVRTLFY